MNAQDFNITKLDVKRYGSLVHSWVSQPYAHYWMMDDLSENQVLEFYENMAQSRHAQGYLGFYKDVPCFLIEVYDPRHDPVGETYTPQEGDMGMHILVAPTETPIRGFTSQVFQSVMEFLFSDPTIQRVVVEPDHRNSKIHALNKRFGFRHQQLIKMGEKTAYLAFCTRQQFEISKKLAVNTQPNPYIENPDAAAQNLNVSVWRQVNRLHLRKCISELCHERILIPDKLDDLTANSRYKLVAPNQNIAYEFTATILPLDHWLIDSDSISKTQNGMPANLDSLNFIIEFNESLGIPQDQLPTYLEEISATLYSSAYKLTKQDALTSQQLVDASFQQIEAAMTEGHPTFLANNGRIGFDAHDFMMFAPETGGNIQLLWLAAHKNQTTFACSEHLSYEALLQQEFDLTTLNEFFSKLTSQGLDPNDYLLMPVHPWQWFNKLCHCYAADIANQHLVLLGYSDDLYQPQQSIRTFFNKTNPQNHYVKTALSVLNMGFMRGLSASYMKVTPAINDWLYDLIKNDGFLKTTGFTILREIASVGYSNHYYENSALLDNPYKKMLAGLWRESPTKHLNNGEKAMTMAALLHVDSKGKALLPELINASNLDVEIWLSHYLKAYLLPLVHCYYQYDLVYMPHGENLILVMNNHVPVRAIMKDIGEEICLLNSDMSLPDDVKRISVKVPEHHEELSILTDVFDCFFRYLSAILFEHMDFQPQNFWRLVANCILDYQERHPELSGKFAQHNLFADSFPLSCLNRLQLRNNRQMVDLTDPSKMLQFAGDLKNPIAPFD